MAVGQLIFDKLTTRNAHVCLVVGASLVVAVFIYWSLKVLSLSISAYRLCS